MARIHMIMQGKGGATKTTTAAMIAQFLKDQGKDPVCIDTDPVNASFHGYKALNVKSLQIMSEGVINARAWDALVEQICRAKKDVVVDNGATSFLSLLSYIEINTSLELFQSFGQEVFIHIPIVGGESLGHCLSGMEQMVKGLSPQGPKFVVWLSPFLGPIEQGGKSFEELPEYKACKKQFEAIIQFPNFTPPETYGRDLSYLLSNNITFAEALMMQDVPVEGGEEGETEKRSVHGFEIAVLQRISIAKKRVYTMLEASGIFV